MLDSVAQAFFRIRKVASIIRQDGDLDMAQALEEVISGAHDRFATKEKLYRIGELCHPRAGLGDRCPLADSGEWSTEMDLLHDTCAKAFSEIELLPNDFPWDQAIQDLIA